ncbi:MAG: T9SS type A sorting domain-containing protein [Bacteroidota bacterium]|nr:T9SS type A sorting domain-containing protein [Bacteroidota bacterium]
MKKIIVFFISLFISGSVFSQSFSSNKTKRALTFKEIQLQFDKYKQENKLSEKKHWKQYKRFESELLYHTNGKGEPGNPKEYIDAAVELANQKQQSTSAAPWFPVGPNIVPTNLTGYMENGIGRINCVAFHPTNSNTFFVGVAQGGLWKTTNGGTSYTPLTDNLPITRISDICINPSSPNTMYISLCDFEYVGFGLYLNGRKRQTHYGLGVYKTTDGGSTWSPTGLSFQLTNGDASLIRKIVINPSNTNELLACGVSGMYKSTNAGTTWTKQLDSLFWDMVQDPINPNIIYAATGWVKNANDGYANIYKSTNFGASWSLLTTGIPQQGSVQRIKLAIAPSDNNYVYALCCDDFSGFYGIYQSTNAGATWIYKPAALNILEAGTGGSTGGQGTYDLALMVDATNKNKIYTGGVNMWGSTDGGTTFNPSSHWTLSYGNTLHGDIHYIDRQPSTGDIFVCSDGGIYKTSNLQIDTWSGNWTTNWTKMNNGIQVTSFYRLSSSKNNAVRLIAGAQDNASIYYDGTSWSTIFGGDGMDNYLNPLNNQEIVGSSQYGYFYYSNDGGNTGTSVGSNPNFESSEWVTPIVADYNLPGVLYLGNENVVKSTDGGQTWNTLGTIYTNTNTLQNTEISALAVSNTNSNVIYAARRVRYEYGLNGIVFKSTDGGTSFTNITNNLPDTLYYTGIEVNETNSNEAVVCMAGFVGGCKVFKTTNGGASWINISYNLPNLPVNCIKYVPVSGQIMVATDVGVYVLNPLTTNWTSYSLGLPNVIVSDIEFNPSLNKVYVSTFGRGIWESSLSTVTSIKQNSSLSTVEFNVYPSVNNGEFTVDFPNMRNDNQLQIIDVMGRRVYSAKIVQNKTTIKLNVPTGTYYVKLDNKVNLGVKKIVIE